MSTRRHRWLRPSSHCPALWTSLQTWKMMVRPIRVHINYLIYEIPPPNSSWSLLVVKTTWLFCLWLVSFFCLYKPEKARKKVEKLPKAKCASTDAVSIPSSLSSWVLDTFVYPWIFHSQSQTALNTWTEPTKPRLWSAWSLLQCMLFL